MHYYMLNIIEETESQYKSELKLWENQYEEIYIEVGYFDPEDPCSTHGIPLTKHDAKALINELSRLLKQIDDRNVKPKLSLQPTINQRSTEGESTLGNQQTTNNQPGQQLTLQKVNWGAK